MKQVWVLYCLEWQVMWPTLTSHVTTSPQLRWMASDLTQMVAYCEVVVWSCSLSCDRVLFPNLQAECPHGYVPAAQHWRNEPHCPQVHSPPDSTALCEWSPLYETKTTPIHKESVMFVCFLVSSGPDLCKPVGSACSTLQEGHSVPLQIYQISAG